MTPRPPCPIFARRIYGRCGYSRRATCWSNFASCWNSSTQNGVRHVLRLLVAISRQSSRGPGWPGWRSRALRGKALAVADVRHVTNRQSVAPPLAGLEWRITFECGRVWVLLAREGREMVLENCTGQVGRAGGISGWLLGQNSIMNPPDGRHFYTSRWSGSYRKMRNSIDGQRGRDCLGGVPSASRATAQAPRQQTAQHAIPLSSPCTWP